MAMRGLRCFSSRSSSVAKRWFASASDVTPLTADILKYGVECLKNGKVDDALRTLEHGVTMIDDPAARGPVELLQGHLHVERGRHDAAVEAYKSLLGKERPPLLRMAAHESLAQLCLKEGEDQQAAAVVQSAMADASQAAPGSALMVRAYALTAFMYHASGDIAAAASLCGQAMQEWDRDAAGVDADRDARVASSLKYASAGLHATLSMADDDVLKNMGWAYLRTVNAAAAAEGLIDTDPISTLSALHVEADALLGYSQVLIARGLFTEAEKQLTVVMDMVEGPNGGEGIARTPGRVQRVGIVLSVLANLYRQRCIKERMGIEKQLGEKVHEDGGGSFILAEGLYQRAFQMLGCPTHLSQEMKTVPPVDAATVALMQGQYSRVLENIAGRQSEASRWRERAEKLWENMGASTTSLAVVMGEEVSTSITGNAIIDLRTGRLLMPLSKLEMRSPEP